MASGSKVPDDPLQRQRTPSPLPDLNSRRTSPRHLTSSTFAARAGEADARGLGPAFLAPPHQPLIHFDDEGGPSTNNGSDERSQRLRTASPSTSSRQASPRTTPRKARDAAGILIDHPTNTMSSPSRANRQAAREDAKPGHIALPPEVDNFAHREGIETLKSPDRSPGELRFDEGGRARRLSFKRRRGPEASSERSGAGSAAANFFKRASIASGMGKRRASNNASDVRRPSGLRRGHGISGTGDDDGNDDPNETGAWERKPRIPSLMPAAQAAPNTTPIPAVPFVVLCLVCFGEFSSAGVAGPFLFFQIESFNVGGESEVAYWAGVVASVFFFAQFLTSMLWASAATKHGRRAVLLVSLIGNAVTLVLFGMSTNLKFAISVRLAQGLFNGAVGVAKGAIRDLTDDTNEGRAMAQLGFAWGMGGIIGPLIGGLLCNPRDKFPWLISEDSFLATYPYVLPCLIVASFTATGAFLTLFIGYDGGPRTGAIHLPEKGDIERITNRAASVVGSLRRSAGQRGSGYFAGDASAAKRQDAGAPGESMIGFGHGTTGAARSPSQAGGNKGLSRTFTQQVDEETGGPPTPLESDDDEAALGTRFTTRDTNSSGFTSGRVPRFARSRFMSRTTARHRSILGDGSAYGYDGAYAGSVTGSAAHNRTSMAGAGNDRRSLVGGRGGGHRHAAASQYAPDFEDLVATSPQKLSFAQRFLLANDDAVLGLTDLWVAAAITGDETFAAEEEEEYDDFGGLDYGEDETRGDGLYEDDDLLEEHEDVSVFDRSETRDSTGSAAFGHDEADEDSPLVPRHLPPLNFARKNRLASAGAFSRGSGPGFRRRSSAGGRMPSVYQNTGIESQPLLSPGGGWPSSPGGNGMFSSNADGQGQGGYDPTLAGIPESASVPGTLKGKGSQGNGLHGMTYGNGNDSHFSAATITQQRQEQQSQQVANAAAAGSTAAIMKQLPLSFIAHYCLLGFHSSTFDQVFMAYLVTPFASGGLGLTAAHYAELIAAMAIFQIVFQFYFYPKIGPPQGKLSHLSMMRLGTMMYLPVYVLFASLRIFLHPSTDAIVMAFMILFAALRLLANVCAFTSVSILMNATTQPHLVPLANGLAQTISSAARFLGPLLGGMLWARGIQGGYETHVWPFNYWLGFEVVGLLAFAGFLHSWLIR